MTEPSRKDRTRPAELLLISAGLAVFIALIVLMSTRQWILALIFGGILVLGGLVLYGVLASVGATN